jgi:hypothetical protein
MYKWDNYNVTNQGGVVTKMRKALAAVKVEHAKNPVFLVIVSIPVMLIIVGIKLAIAGPV